MKESPSSFSSLRRFLAWCVHFYTATGLLCAAGIAALLIENGPESYRWGFILMMVATIIDATDGTLARARAHEGCAAGFRRPAAR